MVIKHKKFGEFTITKDPLLQVDVEAFFKHLRENGIKIGDISGIEYSGGCVRAAISLGWIKPQVEIEKITPAKTLWINKELQEYIAKSLSYDEKN